MGNIIEAVHELFDKLETEVRTLLSGKVATDVEQQVHQDVSTLVGEAKTQAADVLATVEADAKTDAEQAVGDVAAVAGTASTDANHQPAVSAQATTPANPAEGQVR